MPLGVEQLVRGLHAKTVRGLFHGRGVMAGYKCADKGKRPKTKRDWQPNTQFKFLYSEALDRKLRLVVTTHALKCIDKAGGLDMYILTEPVASKTSIVCEQLREVIVEAYRDKKKPLPTKQGPLSILQVVREKMESAGYYNRDQVTPNPPGDATPGSVTTSAPRVHTFDINDAYAPRQGHNINLSSGKKPRQEALEAVIVEKREHERKSRKRAAYVQTMYNTARNAELRHKALQFMHPAGGSADDSYGNLLNRSDVAGSAVNRRRMEALVSLDELPESMGAAQKEKFEYLREMYGVNVPGVIVDGTFVPAIGREVTHLAEGSRGGGVVYGKKAGYLPSFHYAHTKKLSKLRKWLDTDRWRKESYSGRLVLPNGMMVVSNRRASRGRLYRSNTKARVGGAGVTAAAV